MMLFPLPWGSELLMWLLLSARMISLRNGLARNQMLERVGKAPSRIYSWNSIDNITILYHTHPHLPSNTNTTEQLNNTTYFVTLSNHWAFALPKGR